MYARISITQVSLFALLNEEFEVCRCDFSHVRQPKLVRLSILLELLSMIHAEVWVIEIWYLKATSHAGRIDTWCFIEFVIVSKTFLKCIWINQDLPAHTTVLCR